MDQGTSENVNFTDGQQRFIRRWAALPFLTIKATAEAVAVSDDRAYQWRKDPEFVAACKAARTATQDELAEEALAALREALPDIARAKIELAMHARDERARDSAGSWVFEWMLGKATERVEHSGAVGVSLNLTEIVQRMDEHRAERERRATEDSGVQPG